MSQAVDRCLSLLTESLFNPAIPSRSLVKVGIQVVILCLWWIGFTAVSRRSR